MNEALTALGGLWELELADGITEAELLAALSRKVSELLAKDPEHFYRIMYRLDIAEQKVVQAVNSPDAGPALARLIFQRQWQKAASRAARRPGECGEEDLKW